MPKHTPKRRKRRAWKRGDVVLIDLGYLHEADPNRQETVACYVCGVPHKGLCLARIRDGRTEIIVPLCEPCHAADGKAGGVVRKYMKAPDLKLTEGGELTDEQVEALRSKTGATEH